MNTDQIKVLSRCQDNAMGVSLALRALKLQEETGEVAAAVLCNLGSGNKSASAKNNVAEEVVDVIINGFDILYALGVSDSEIQDLLDTKLDKWKRKLEALQQMKPFKEAIVEKFELHKKTCKPNKKVNVARSVTWDSWGCLDCGEWLQAKCPDKNCEFCVNRPEKFEGP